MRPTVSRDTDRRRMFTRRALMLGGAQALLGGLLAGRLYQLQIIESERFATLADDNRIDLRVFAMPRGRILDRFGKPVATNRQQYRVLLVAEQASDIDSTLQLLSRLIPIDEAMHERVLRDIGRSRKFLPVAVTDSLTWEDVARIEVNALDLPGISIDEGFSRIYPYGPALAHVVGYVAPVAENDPVDDPLLQLPGFKIGKAGIEKIRETPLRGVGGTTQMEVNAIGRPIRELSRREGAPGQDVRLTIDVDLQTYATERFGTESGAAVVLDILTGDVLALVSTPAYDPNLFGNGISTAQWQSLIRNPKAPLINKAISGQYAPGSTFKPVVALAALDRGVITPSTTVHCSGALRLGGHVFHCWSRRGHGAVALRQGLAQSCDLYFYELARRTGVERIAAIGRKLGLGVRLDIELPHEKAGLLPTPDWKRAALGGAWNAGETVMTGIGQGYVLSTPLQLAVMTARIAGGTAIAPRIVLPAAGEESPGPPPLAIPPGHLKLMRDGMTAVVKGGTASRAAIRQSGFEMAGKTGTSQVRRITKAERRRGVIRNEDLPWERRDHALFIGYAPIAAPRYACAVIVEHGGGGSKAAAPIARDLLLMVQRLAADRDGTLNRPPPPTPGG
jgi:penicillin-binding protein 2